MMIVGRLKCEEAKNVFRGFEYAGAGEYWDLDECEVELRYNGRWFLASRPGTRVDSWFQNRIGSVYGSDNRDKTPVRGEYGIQFDAFRAGELVNEGRLALDEGWVCEQIGEYSSGKPMYHVHREEESPQWVK